MESTRPLLGPNLADLGCLGGPKLSFILVFDAFWKFDDFVLSSAQIAQDGPNIPRDSAKRARKRPEDDPKSAQREGPRGAQDGSTSHLIAISCCIVFDSITKANCNCT